MKLIFYISKSLYIGLLICFIGQEIRESGSVFEASNYSFLLVFYLLSAILVIISILSCFAPIERPYDLSIIFPEMPPLKKGKFASHQFKRFMIILENIGNITIYLSIIYYVFDPSIEKILYIAYSFIPLACFYLITAFVPEISRQDLSKVFPELLN